MSSFVYREPVPERVLPAADESVVIADGTIPVDASQVVSAGIGHHHPGATAPSWTSATANARFVIKVSRGIDNDAGEILRKQPRRGRHIGECARWVEVMPEIDDPGITHALWM
jgi:hypothetical protein